VPRVTGASDCCFRLDGKTAFISGGGTGIGFAIAKAMVASGAHVVLAGRRPQVLNDACAQLGDSAEPLSLDVTDKNAIDSLVRELNRRRPAIDILVNNAGNHLKKPATDTTLEEFDAVLSTHVGGAFSLTRSLLPSMLKQGEGSILFIASMSSFIGMPQIIAYSAAKSAYLGMVRSLAAEVSGRGVRVNAIAPGWIDTPMLATALAGDVARRNKILGRTPMARLGEPRDIGDAAVYLSSPAARFITGVVLPIDGGASIGF
jgi:gluconate 5-dehydrogenase